MKTKLIIGESEQVKIGQTYLRAGLANQLNGLLQVSSMYGIAYLNPQQDITLVWGLLNIGFHGEFFRRRGVAFIDQIVHDEVVDIAEGTLASELIMISICRIVRC